MLGSQSARVVAVASVGNGGVSLGLAQLNGGTFSLLAHASRALPAEEREAAHAASALKDMLAQAGQEILAREEARRVVDVYCVIRAPWTHTEVSQAKTVFADDQHVNEALISGLARQALSHSGGKDLLDATVAQVMLNGYPTKHPEGKRARKLELTALISSCEPSMRQAVLSGLQTLFPSRTPKLYSGTRAIAGALMLARPHMNDCLVLDVGQAGTAAIIARDGAPEQESYLQEGITSMLARAAPQAKPEETLSALRMMARDECASEACIAVQEAFAKMEPDLAHVFGEFFAKLIVSRRLPHDLVLITHPDIAGWLSRFLSRIDFTQFTEIAQPFSPDVLSAADLALHAGKDAPDADIDLSLALALINKEMSEA